MKGRRTPRFVCLLGLLLGCFQPARSADLPSGAAQGVQIVRKIYTNDLGPAYVKVLQAWYEIAIKAGATTNVVTRHILDLDSLPPTYSFVTNALGKPLVVTEHKVPDLIGVVDGKAVKMTAQFMWFGSLGLGFQSNRAESKMIAIACDPNRDTPQTQPTSATTNNLTDVQSSAEKTAARIAKNPDQVPVHVSVRRPSDVRVTNLRIVGLLQEDSAKLKKYGDLKGCVAIEVRLTLAPEWATLKPPYLRGVSQVPDECRHLLRNGEYKYAGWTWSHGTDVVLGDDGEIYTGAKGALTFVWFVPSDTTTVDMVLPNHKPVTIELPPPK
jgi:hypothetical protein